LCKNDETPEYIDKLKKAKEARKQKGGKLVRITETRIEKHSSANKKGQRSKTALFVNHSAA